MNVKFYNCSSDPAVVNKYLTGELVLPCQVTDSLDYENPTLLLDLTQSKISKNYALMEGRYYFLEEPEIINGHHVEIRAHIDDLMTHKAAIMNAQIIADRSSSNYENYMEDGMVTDSGKIAVKIRKLPKMFDTANVTNNYVIILGGK